MNRDQDKLRILNPRLAAAVATLRHGEMIFVGDAGGGISAKSLAELASDVEVLDLAVATGVPTLEQVVEAIVAVGDIEGAIVTTKMREASPGKRAWLDELLGENDVHEVAYIPDYYVLRDRSKLFVRTGDYGQHAQAILIGGHPSANVPLEFLMTGDLSLIGRSDQTE